MQKKEGRFFGAISLNMNDGLDTGAQVESVGFNL